MKSTKTKFSREIEVDGHLIDSMILTRIFDKIMDLKGEFEVTDFKIGVKKSDPSHVKLTIIGKNKEHLRKMLEETYRIGKRSRKRSRISEPNQSHRTCD